MELPSESLVVIAQIIPVLLLASFLDGDVLKQLREYGPRAQYYWLALVGFILIGELFALMAIANGGAIEWRAWLIWFAVLVSMANLFSVAMWRVRGVSFLAMTGLEKKDESKKPARK